MDMVTFRHVLPLGQLVPSSEKGDSPPEGHEQEEGEGQEQDREQTALLRLRHPQTSFFAGGLF